MGEVVRTLQGKRKGQEGRYTTYIHHLLLKTYKNIVRQLYIQPKKIIMKKHVFFSGKKKSVIKKK